MTSDSLSTSVDRQSAAVRYGLAIGVTLGAVYLRDLLTPLLGTKSPFLTMWAALFFSAWYCGRGPSVVSMITGLLGIWYWVLPPRASFGIPASEDLYGLIGFLLVSSMIITMGEAHRRSHLKIAAAEREALRTKLLFETFMDNSPAVAFLKDEEGRYVYMNRTSRERFHVTAPVGKTDAELYPLEIAAQNRENDTLVLAENKTREFVERTMEADGQRTWLSLKFPVVDGHGRRMVGGKSFDITDRYRSEEALREARQQLEARVEERTEELSKANDSLRELSARLLQMRDDEARRLARELHDSAGQLLAAMKMNFSFVKSEMDKLSPVALRALSENEGIVEQLLSEIRTISHLLHPPLLDEVGLRSALSWFVDEFSARSKIDVTLEIDASPPRLTHELETAIFRIVQECLTNVNRHSCSKTAAIRIERQDRRVIVIVQDAGKGIPPEKLGVISKGRSGVGFRGMRERIHFLGGTMEIQSSRKGTLVKAVLPMPEEAAAPPPDQPAFPAEGQAGGSRTSDPN